MQFVPIPTTPEYLEKTFPHWWPFLAKISRRSKEPVQELLGQIVRRDVQIALVWDGEKARALVGMRFLRRGGLILEDGHKCPDVLIGEVIWLAGGGMREWRHLLPQMEQYFKHMGCVEIRPVCRLGWSRFLKTQGYKATHVTMEKVLS
jgi:hypothetical protein